jgi:AcrR family transcriptional regulator
MPPSTRKTTTDERTFTEEARRKQIIEAAIEVIAEWGYGNASLAAIAEKAGTSKSVISYHFSGGKDELITEVIKQVYGVGGEFIVPRLQGVKTAREGLRMYITTNLDFLVTHPKEVRALVEIFANFRPVGGVSTIEVRMRSDVDAVERELLRPGQAIGEFRDFDAHVMAVTLRAAIDALPALLFEDPAFDVKHYADELAELFDRATRGGSRPTKRAHHQTAHADKERRR